MKPKAEREKQEAEREKKAKSFNKSLAERLHNVYYDGWAFPMWTIDKVAPMHLKTARVYYRRGADTQLVKKVATEREPVNMAIRGKIKRYYSQVKLESLFGWRTGFYGRYYKETGLLAPNIGVYTLAAMKMNDGNEGVYVGIHIYNAIGYAFDSKNQPDYRYFFNDDGRLTKIRRDELFSAYLSVFERIYVCAKQQSLTMVVMSLVGADTFGKKYRGVNGTTGPEALRREIWLPALANIRARHPGIETVFMGISTNLANKEKGLEGVYKNIGRFPANYYEVEPETTLFVNAWDPFSLPGNGNDNDNTLDGWMGRFTTIALTGSFMTNKHMQLVPVPDPVVI